MATENCPVCGEECDVLSELVDIGVGNMEHFSGWNCQTCGIISICENCGYPDIDDRHHANCGVRNNVVW